MTKKSRYKKAADTLTQLLNEPGDYDEKVMKELDASPTTTDPENVSTKKSFADTCLDRAEKATPGPWVNNTKYHGKWAVCAEETDQLGPLGLFTLNSNFPEIAQGNSAFIAHARTDVPELARRLKKACEMLKQPKRNMDMLILADELETFPEGEK